MPKLTYDCPLCGKQLKLKEEITFGDETLYSYTCGHMFSKSIQHFAKENISFASVDGSLKKARHYQEDGVQFILESDFNCILADQMRLGKTPQGLLALQNRFEERTPCLIIVKGANLWQWTREFKTWVTVLPNGIFPIIGSNAWIPPGFSAYIISMDTFSKPKIQDALKRTSFKLIIADEAHSFKNTSSNRSQALVDFVRFQNTGEYEVDVNIECPKCHRQWTEKTGKKTFDKRLGIKTIYIHTKCTCGWYINQSAGGVEKDEKPENKPCGIILLTGTPILNRADEYFVPLNLVNPEKFDSLERFRRTWLAQDDKGRWSKVKNSYLPIFKDTIKPYFLRREKQDVYTDLPPLNKIVTLIEVERSKFTKLYNDVLDKMEYELAKKTALNFMDVRGHLMELRRICGLMKLSWATDYLQDCAEETDAKYAIGIHHETVRDMLYLSLGGEQNCFKLSGADNADRKDWIMRNWGQSNKQFLIINMLAGGVGMDFHYCDNVLVLERQWSSELENQFEFRFYNPDKSIKTNSTNVEYVVAKDTWDQDFYDYIESKRRVVGETVYNDWNLERDLDSFRGLVERTTSRRL